jgi:hypothetical protein
MGTTSVALIGPEGFGDTEAADAAAAGAAGEVCDTGVRFTGSCAGCGATGEDDPAQAVAISVSDNSTIPIVIFPCIVYILLLIKILIV